MEACGLITEYNPFHQGHLYHFEKSREKTGAECMIAVMSGNFLQRGEPAVIDKFHRAEAALQAGIDLVVELPFAFAVQNSDIFAKGATSILSMLHVSSLCFGSETGNITPFIESYKRYRDKQPVYQAKLKDTIATGLSFPEASRKAYEAIGLTSTGIDLTKPNNILGFSYIKSIHENRLKIEPFTIKRIHNDYHSSLLSGRISSATSIRKEILDKGFITEQTSLSLTADSTSALKNYKTETDFWHNWEAYFPFLQYRIATMSPKELRMIHGMEEGLEYRLKKTVRAASSFDDWMSRIKTKRYTWTRLQRLFSHLLVNSKKEEMDKLLHQGIPYVRILGMSANGQLYLNQIKKRMQVPLFSQLQQSDTPLAELEERAAEAYYSILSPAKRRKVIQQEYLPPLRR